MPKSTWPPKQAHMTPLAYDFTPDGLRIWQGGEVVGIIPDNAHGNLIHALVKRLAERNAS